MISRCRGAPPLQLIGECWVRSKCRRRYQIWSAWVMPKLFGSKKFVMKLSGLVWSVWVGVIVSECLYISLFSFFVWGWSNAFPPRKKIQPTSFSPERPEVSFCPDPKLLGQLFGMSTYLENGRLQQQKPSPGFTRKSGAAFTAIYEKAPEDHKLMASVNAGNPKKLKAWRIHPEVR